MISKVQSCTSSIQKTERRLIFQGLSTFGERVWTHLCDHPSSVFDFFFLLWSAIMTGCIERVEENTKCSSCPLCWYLQSISTEILSKPCMFLCTKLGSLREDHSWIQFKSSTSLTTNNGWEEVKMHVTGLNYRNLSSLSLFVRKDSSLK